MWGTNSLTDPSLAVPYEGKGLDPDLRKVQVNARDGIIIAEKLIVNGTLSYSARADMNGRSVETLLSSANFTTGTQRIRQGGVYKLTENITFNAPVGAASTRADTPISGFWFAGITVETTSAVTIDGCGYTLTVAPEYTNKNAFGSFAVVLLGNNQFSGAVFGGASGRFPDTSAFVAAANVTIKNLRIIGAGSHFGVMMNNSDNVILENCTIEDCQVANVYAQSPQGLSLTNTKLLGSTTPIKVTMEQTQLALMRAMYAQLIAASVAGAQAQLDLLEGYVIANPTRFDPNLITPQAFPSSYYALFVNPGPTALFSFPMTLESSAVSASFVDGARNGYYGSNVTIDNCEIRNCSTLFNELVLIGSNIPKSPIFPLSSWPLILFGLFGGIQWKDAFNGGVFEPNEFLRSIVFLMNYLWNLPAPIPPILPANSQDIFTAILTKPVTGASTLLFNNNAAPIVSNQSDATLAKGNFAVRICTATNVSIRNSIIENINSTQTVLPVDQTTLPGYGALATPQAAFRSYGNDSWAVSLEACKNVVIENNNMKNITSARGFTFGVDLAGEADCVTMRNNKIDGMSSPNTTVTPSIAAGLALGYPVRNNVGPVSASDCTTKSLSAGLAVTPFFTVSTAATTVNGNQNLTSTPFTLTVASTAGFPTNGLISVVTTDALSVRTVQYSGTTATTFTGCIAIGAAAPILTLDTSAVASVGRSQVNCLSY